MSGSIVSLKSVKKEDKTLKETIEMILNDQDVVKSGILGDFRAGLLIIDSGEGLRAISLKDASMYEYLGILEVAKASFVESLYCDE